MKFLSCLGLFLSFWIGTVSANNGAPIQSSGQYAVFLAPLPGCSAGPEETLFSGKHELIFTLFNPNQQVHSIASGSEAFRAEYIFSEILFKELQQEADSQWIWRCMKAKMLFPVHYYW